MKQTLSPHAPGEKRGPEEVKGRGQDHGREPRDPLPSASVLLNPGFGPPIAPLPSRAAPPALDLSDPPGQGHSAPRAADQQSTQPRGGPWVPLPPRPLLKIHSSEGLGSDGPLPTVLWLGYQAPEQDTSPSPTSTSLATRTPSRGSASQSEAGAQPPRLV